MKVSIRCAANEIESHRAQCGSFSSALHPFIPNIELRLRERSVWEDFTSAIRFKAFDTISITCIGMDSVFFLEIGCITHYFVFSPIKAY